jgi:hypothetical protein
MLLRQKKKKKKEFFVQWKTHFTAVHEVSEPCTDADIQDWKENRFNVCEKVSIAAALTHGKPISQLRLFCLHVVEQWNEELLQNQFCLKQN